MDDNKNFNELLIEILKQIHVRLDRIEAGIAMLRWVIGAQVAIIGVILAIFRIF